MSAYEFCILLSSISFLGYSIAYFAGPKMKAEFKRFGLEQFALLTVVLEIVGALGLLVGFYFSYPIILQLSAGGLSLLMLLGVIVRLKIKDGLFVTLPALFFCLLNGYIFWNSLGL